MSENNTELDKYINDLSDISDDAGDSSITPSDGGTDGQDDGQQLHPDTVQQDDGTSAQDQSAGQDEPRQQQKADGKKDQQQSKGKKDARQDQLRPLGDGTFANSKGDIVDNQGRLIAQNGFAARMYHTNRRLKATLEERDQQLNQLSQAVGEVRALASAIQQAGLTNDEVAQAMDMASRMKRGDVLGVAKDVLAIIAAQGYNVTDLLGSDVGDSLELRAMKRMLDERLAPITREEQARQQQAQAAERGRAAYERFIQQNDFAEVHANEIVNVMRRENVNPQVAYNRLLQFASANGLDFSKPLAPQIALRIKQQQQQQQSQQARQKPMPNGAVTRGRGAIPSVPLASADDDWGTIISEVQKTLGTSN